MAGIFDGKTVLISGSTGGFGTVAAQMFADQGARLLLTDFPADRLAGQAAALQKKRVSVESLAGDIADEETSIKCVALAMEKFGRLDIAINNAGIAHSQGKLPDVSSAEARKTIEVNVMGVFYAMKHQIPAMLSTCKETGQTASIVNVASVAGLVGAPTMSMYVAGKHAVVGMTKSAALEYARKHIRINALCPAFSRTPIVTESLLGAAEDQQAAQQHLVRGVPMRRLAEPAEITQAMLWLCDPANSFTTGQAIAIDGGVTAF
jgi:NAD(P)-dependent dehydrogenase (short-subunit alcohol dehydrogenase family)